MAIISHRAPPIISIAPTLTDRLDRYLIRAVWLPIFQPVAELAGLLVAPVGLLVELVGFLVALAGLLVALVDEADLFRQNSRMVDRQDDKLPAYLPAY